MSGENVFRVRSEFPGDFLNQFVKLTFLVSFVTLYSLYTLELRAILIALRIGRVYCDCTSACFLRDEFVLDEV